ncbi:MAG: CehA/McbA family metallohydrolase [Armatimonadota bacterium]
MRRFFVILMLLIFTAGCNAEKKPVVPASVWLKGNTHMHSALSDGDVSPEQALKWYKDHGFDFTVLTDHNKISDAGFFDANSDNKFTAISGEEVTPAQNNGNFAVHMNAIGVSQLITPVSDPDKAKMLKLNCDLISNTGSIVQINHPSFNVTDPDAIKGLSGKFLIEVFNNSAANDKNYATLAQMVFEQAWDAALTAGLTAYAVAADDTHDYKEIKPGNSNPGGGWIMVNAAKNTRQEILKSIADGKFYASTGVEIAENKFDGKVLSVSVKPVEGKLYSFNFIGKNGKLLSRKSGLKAEYKLTGSADEAYVRVRVKANDQTAAWLQPVRPK